MIAYVLTDSEFIAALLLRLITKEDQADVYIKAFASSTLYSLARTLLLERDRPVAVVVDANTPNPEGIARERRGAEELLRDVAGGLRPFKVVLAVPEIEAVFFERPEVLRRRFDGAVTDHLLELGQYSARAALRKLAADGDGEKLRWEILNSLTDDEVAALRRTDLIREVLEFMGLARRRSRPVATAGV